MEDSSLVVYALEKEAPPLRLLRDALQKTGYPISLGVEIAGEASDEQLEDLHWETVWVRWMQPELHDVWLITRNIPGVDEEADLAITVSLRKVANHPDSAGRLIVADHLRRSQAVYSVEIAPPLFDDEDHPGWEALDVALRTLAENTEGLIYGEADGFYDADGEILLDEADDE